MVTNKYSSTIKKIAQAVWLSTLTVLLMTSIFWYGAITDFTLVAILYGKLINFVLVAIFSFLQCQKHGYQGFNLAGLKL